MLRQSEIPSLKPGRHYDSPRLWLRVGEHKRGRDGSDATSRVWLFKVQGRWTRIGDWPEWTVTAARKRASELLVQKQGGRPVNLTLKAAYERWKALPGPRSELTLSNSKTIFSNHFKGWHDKDIGKITRDDLDYRHERIKATAGPMAARNSMIAFRTWWNQARLLDPQLPESPTVAAQMVPQPEKDRTDLYNRLHEWHEALSVIRSPVRRCLYEFALLTGMRRTSLMEARWEHVRQAPDGGSVLHVPKPKAPRGKPPRPYDVPLVGAHLAILTRLDLLRRAMAPQSPWLFPGDRTDHITDATLTKAEQREWTERGAPEFTPHALRACFMTAGTDELLPDRAVSLLMNHTVKGTAGSYVGRGLTLRVAMERICSRLQSQISGR